MVSAVLGLSFFFNLKSKVFQSVRCLISLEIGHLIRILLETSFSSRGRGAERERERKREEERCEPRPCVRSDCWLAESSLMSSVYDRALLSDETVLRVRECLTEDDAWTRSCEQSQTHPSWKSHPGRSVIILSQN